jgi:hypothetical protein
MVISGYSYMVVSINSRYLELHIIESDNTLDNIIICHIDLSCKMEIGKCYETWDIGILPQILEFRNNCTLLES